MHNTGEIMQLCRLCLVKEQVNVPIFEGQGDVRQIFQKISSCLPVKINRSDKLPKNICDGCSEKLDLFYDFWNTSVNSEKQLLEWLGQTPLSAGAGTTIAAKNSTTKPTDPVQQIKVDVKQEPSDHTDNNESFQAEAAAMADDDEFKEESAPPPKRARRAVTKRKPITVAPDSDDDDDDDYEPVEPLTKLEDESGNSDNDNDNDNEDDSFAAPSTSADDQPGPSGLGKDGVEAPRTFLTVSKNLMPTTNREEPETVVPSGRYSKQLFKKLIPRSYKCNYCNCTPSNYWSSFYGHLVKHMSKDKDLQKFSCMCLNCNYYYGKPFNLQMESHKSLSKCRFSCLICFCLLESFQSLKQHMISKHADVQYSPMRIKCLFCKTLNFSTTQELKNHMSLSHKNVFKNLIQGSANKKVVIMQKDDANKNISKEILMKSIEKVKIKPVEPKSNDNVLVKCEPPADSTKSKSLIDVKESVCQDPKQKVKTAGKVGRKTKQVLQVQEPQQQPDVLKFLKVSKVCSIRTYSRKKTGEAT